MSGFALRYWKALFVVLYVLGFLAPWQWLSHSHEVTLWLTGPTLLERAGWFDLASATHVVTVAALLCLGIGALLCLWGAAYDTAAGRRAMYAGTWSQAVGASVLMPVSGSVLFLIGCSVLTLSLLFATEQFAGTGSTQPQWARALIREIFPISFTVCFAVFAWRYNAHVLIRCLLVCAGVSLVARAFIQGEERTRERL